MRPTRAAYSPSEVSTVANAGLAATGTLVWTLRGNPAGWICGRLGRGVGPRRAPLSTRYLLESNGRRRREAGRRPRVRGRERPRMQRRPTHPAARRPRIKPMTGAPEIPTADPRG